MSFGAETVGGADGFSTTEHVYTAQLRAAVVKLLDQAA